MRPYTRLQKKNDERETAEANVWLMHAARHGEFETADCAICCDNGADLECRDEEGDGETPLMMACQEGHLHIVKLLIEHGANVNTLDFDGDTALAHAARNGENKIVKCLIDAGADVNVRNRYKFTALDYAVRTLNLESQKHLLRAGAMRSARLEDICELQSYSEDLIIVERPEWFKM